jgi:transposase
MGITRCKLSKKQQRRLLEFFVLEVTARSAADLLGIHSNTTALFYRKIREIIATQLDTAFPEPGHFEVDESYFGGTRKGKRGRGAAGKVPVFGILKRGGQVYTQVIGNTKTATLLPIIRQKLQPDSVVYTDSFRSYNALDISEFKHYRINHSELFAARHNHINGVENFWNQAKRVLRKYNGIRPNPFICSSKSVSFALITAPRNNN